MICYILLCNIYWDTHISIQLCELWRYAKVLPLKMLFHVFEFHLQFWQMCKLFANKLYSINTYFYSPVWIMMVYNNFDAQNLLFICLQISPQIFAILQNFPINNLRDQQFCTLLCELERPVVVLFTGIALEVEVPPGQAWCDWQIRRNFSKILNFGKAIKEKSYHILKFGPDLIWHHLTSPDLMRPHMVSTDLMLPHVTSPSLMWP